MSVQAITWVIGHPEITDRSTWAVLIALANRSDPEGWSWPAQDRIARESRSSLSTVKRVIRHAIDSGWLEVRPRVGTSSHYHLLIGGEVTVTYPPRKGRSSSDLGVGQAMTQGGRSSYDLQNVNMKRQEPRRGPPGPVDNFDPVRPSAFVLSEEQKEKGAAELAAIRDRLRSRSATNGRGRDKLAPLREDR